MEALTLRPASRSDLHQVAAVYARVGFRDDLIDDVAFLRERVGGGLFVAERGGRMLGVASVLPFASTGWLGGIAVVPEEQRRGIGRRLTELAMSWLEQRGAGTLLLHSTAAGRKLYRDLGFREEYDCLQLVHPDGRPARPAGDAPATFRKGTREDLPSVLELDRMVTGEDRSLLLSGAWPGSGRIALTEDGEVLAYHLPIARGALGAVIAGEHEAGVALLNAAAAADPSARVAEPETNEAALRLLRDLGYKEDFRVTRMCRGPEPAARPESMFALFNLYWG